MNNSKILISSFQDLNNLDTKDVGEIIHLNNERKLPTNLIIPYGGKFDIQESVKMEGNIYKYTIYNQIYFLMNNLNDDLRNILKEVFPNTKEDIKNKTYYCYKKIESDRYLYIDNALRNQTNFICEMVDEYSLLTYYTTDNYTINSIIENDENEAVIIYNILNPLDLDVSFRFIIDKNNGKCSFGIYYELEEQVLKQNLQYIKSILLDSFTKLGITEDKSVIVKYFDNKSIKKLISLNSKVKEYKRIQQNSIMKSLNLPEVRKGRVYRFPRIQSV